jgi:hypothetical protein
LVKLSIDKHVRATGRDYRNKSSELRHGLDLEAELTLQLCIGVRGSLDSPSKPLKHDLSFFVLGKQKYTTLEGKVVHYVEEAGIQVPEGNIATIEFYQDSTDHTPIGQVGRIDESWGTVYAGYSEVHQAFDSLREAITEIEKQEVDIRAVCPEAKTDRKGPVTISIAGAGRYFNAFNHYPQTRLPENYHSSWKDLGVSFDIQFIPGSPE